MIGTPTSAMKTAETFSAELDALVLHHYYSEEWELRSAAGLYFESLDPAERLIFRDMFVARLKADPSVVNISLSPSFKFPEVVNAIADCLDAAEQASCFTRTMMTALRPYHEDRAFHAVARFIDSEQEIEALRIVAEINFIKAIPHLRRAFGQDHLVEVCLHIFNDRKRKTGMDQLVREIQLFSEERPRWYRRRLKAMFLIKVGEHSPFSEGEIIRILEEVIR
ncbi:MAG: hypothetical protein ACI9QL_000483 [Candidatus Omnitrophota bacterium]|jgi:hypothetical protein